MKRLRFIPLLAPLALVVFFVGSTPLAADHEGGKFRARLGGFEEVPSISTLAQGDFEAKIEDNTIEFELTFSGLAGTLTAAELHFAQRSVEGGLLVNLCTAGSGCPTGPVTGTIVPGEVLAIPAQGISGTDAERFDKLLRAIRAGAVYVHIHTTAFSDGEIRGQIRRGRGGDRDGGHGEDGSEGEIQRQSGRDDERGSRSGGDGSRDEGRDRGSRR